MADENKSENEAGEQGRTPTVSKESQTGDPGRTPGKAEGDDDDTADESLSEKEAPPRH